ncbi:MAG: GNAT family N-acetyltransferase [Fermentimonas sp.]|nr:GNAT family N-acetyltransferase [Fermentimonas sp.]
MIQFADDSTKQQVWDMWKSVFGDSDDYMLIYFRHKYRNENTLIFFEEDKVVSSLQILPYQFTFCEQEIPVFYLSGVATLPDYRGKGHARELLIRSFDAAGERGIPLVILVPQEDWLLSFYDKFGFAQTFDSGNEDLLSLKKIIENNQGDLYSSYKEFDAIYRKNDMTVQKTFSDFEAIVEEAELFGFPPKRNLRGMARIIDAEFLINIFARFYKDKSFTLKVSDEILEVNNTTYQVSEGQVQKNPSDIIQPLLELDIRELVQLLTGFHTSEKTATINSLFPEKTPVMNMMLE